MPEESVTSLKREMGHKPSSKEGDTIKSSSQSFWQGTVLTRYLFMFIGAMFIVGVLYFALSYPSAKVLVIALILGLILCEWKFRGSWLLFLPSVISAFNFVPWSGRIFFNEFDFCVLAIIGVNLLRPTQNAAWQYQNRSKFMTRLLLILLTVSYLVSVWMYLWPLDPIDENSFSNILSHYNSLKVGRGFFYALILLPILFSELNRAFQRTCLKMLLGLALAAGISGVITLWEYKFFATIFNNPTLYEFIDAIINFGSDYRSTNFFSDMALGGTALDGFLALTTPFALSLLIFSDKPKLMILGMALGGLGLYACVMTFSRGLYGGVLVSLGVLFICFIIHIRKKWGMSHSNIMWHGGRILLYFISASALMYFGGNEALFGAGFAAVGIFISFGVIKNSTWRSLIAGGLFIIGGFLIFDGIGDRPPLEMLPKTIEILLGLTVFLVVSILITRDTKPFGEVAYLPQKCGSAFLLILLIIGSAAVLGGYRMGARFETLNEDMMTRVLHWEDAVQMRTNQLLYQIFGEGVGSYPSYYFWSHLDDREIAGVSLGKKQGRSVLQLAKGNYQVVQRVNIKPEKTYLINIRGRSLNSGKSRISLAFCPRNIILTSLGRSQCIYLRHQFLDGDEWREATLSFYSKSLGEHGFLNWPTALDINASNLALDMIEIIDGKGKNLIKNGEFGEGMDHWYFADDIGHTTWHEKNMFIHIWFENGWFGLVAFLLIILASMRGAILHLKTYPLVSAALLSSISGLLFVGLFGTILDSARVAMLVYLVLVFGLILGIKRPADQSKLQSKI